MIDILECPCCSVTELTSFLTCEDFTVSHETFPLKSCKSCGLLITTPRPDDQHLPEYYQSQDYISHSSRANTIIDRLYLIIRHFTLQWKLGIINQSAPKEKSILDYGCGTGEFLKTCQQDGWAINGVEPSDVARKAAELNTGVKILPTISDNAQKFHTITLWHVLEHVPNLHALLACLSSQLHEDGTLFIAVPNHLSYDARHYQQHWAAYDVPRHLWHFSESTMKLLLNHHNLSVTQIIPMKLDAYYVSMLSEKYLHGGKIKPMSIFKAIFTGLKSNFLARTNGEYSSLIYVVKK